MRSDLNQLTQKEKDVLRLLVRGHDAKSTALSLGLSVHTINDRLREARRKLDVTSSREAARLLYEAEAADPQKDARTLLGDANAARETDPDQVAAVSDRAILLTGGFVLMLSFTLAAAMLAVSALSDDRPPGDPATPLETAQLQEFERSALAWLALVDASDWTASFAAAGQSFQEPNTVQTWREASEQARVPLGAVIERETVTADYVNAPPHGYVIMEFRTDFAKRSGATEKVTLEREGAPGKWLAT
ncbi:MAG: DUF4019 domain-containing protein [Erythrobacter sp.]|uniref:helix-turn-helix domain-containing protein n=1 Tax=Erythrobacter sp. TaxID=1042 RepID=UPI002633E730|nr:DUF4019 domain-containing protein [Erythrobacter sp.]MDJ0978323.1 DUF4019 domain-containing protein [Erythrobacter sp.]